MDKRNPTALLLLRQELDAEFVELQNGSRVRRTWTAGKAPKDVVRAAFGVWEKVGLGLEFAEVQSRDDAEIRIGFMRGDGAWSYVGRDVFLAGRNERTMNFGWDIRNDIPRFTKSVTHWDFRTNTRTPTPASSGTKTPCMPSSPDLPIFGRGRKPSITLSASSRPPRSRAHHGIPIRSCIIRFGPGLIKEPAHFGQTGLFPAPGLSARDKTWVAKWYPPLSPQNPELKALQSQTLALGPGEQKNFVVKPTATRRYNFSTFGTSDSVMVLFEKDGADLKYLTADDDSGEDYNASFRIRLIKGKNVRVTYPVVLERKLG